MNWFQSLIYGLISGISEFLPISSQAHQSLLLYLFGVESPDPIQSLFVHVAILLSLLWGIRPLLEQIRRERSISQRNRRSHGSLRTLADVRLVKNAAVPMIVIMLLFSYIFKFDFQLPLVSLFFVLNGVLLYLPERMIQGNKEAGSMSQFDSYLLGFCGGLSIVPGVSRIGAIVSASVARGAERQKALNWAFLLSVPAVATLICLDLFQIIVNAESIHFFSNIPGYLLSALGAYLSAYLGLILIKQLSLRNGYAAFAYYSWGAALFTFLMYLTVV